MKYISSQKYSFSLCALIICSGIHGAHRYQPNPQQSGPARRNIVIPSEQEQQQFKLEDVVTKQLEQMLQELGVAGHPNTQAILQSPDVIAKAQAFISSFDINTMMGMLNTPEGPDQRSLPQLFHNLMMLPCHAIALSPHKHNSPMASYEQLRYSLIEHLSSAIAVVDHLSQLNQSMHASLQHMLKDQSSQPQVNEILNHLEIVFPHNDMLIQQALENHLQSTLLYTTALWIAHKLSLEELQECLTQQKKNLLLQISAPLNMGLKYFQIFSLQQGSASQTQPLK